MGNADEGPMGLVVDIVEHNLLVQQAHTLHSRQKMHISTIIWFDGDPDLAIMLITDPYTGGTSLKTVPR